MKNIIIDARLYGPKHTGLGRYTKNLLFGLSNLPEFNKYKFSLIIYKNLESEIRGDLGNKFNLIPTNIKHYSFAEQIKLPFLLYKLKPNLVHFTHFDRPLLYFGKSVVTIHDLIKHFSKGKDTTTKNPLLYWPKYFAYLFLSYIIIKTNEIIVPSNFWRNFIIKRYKINSNKITTTYEAIDPNFKTDISKKITTPKNYVIYTGNLYPHKNVKIILEALKKLPNIKLKLISARDIFAERINKLTKDYHLEKQVDFLGYVKDSEFKEIYSNAIAFIHPSLMEGFSLTGLEAMALNCPVISSTSSCLPEIHEKAALYFNPNSSNQLIDQINKLKNSIELRKKIINLGHLQIAKFSWKKTALETLNVYQKLLSSTTG